MDGRKIQREWLQRPEIERDRARAAIAAEDSRFCSHWGFDLEAIGKAVGRNRPGRTLRGGPTISQPAAENAILWPGRSWVPSGLGAWFPVVSELPWSTNRTMEGYRLYGTVCGGYRGVINKKKQGLT